MDVTPTPASPDPQSSTHTPRTMRELGEMLHAMDDRTRRAYDDLNDKVSQVANATQQLFGKVFSEPGSTSTQPEREETAVTSSLASLLPKSALPKVDFFYGNHKDSKYVVQWVSKMDRYFWMISPDLPDESKKVLTMAYLKGPALNLVETMHALHEKNGAQEITTYAQLKEVLVREFQTLDPELQARNRLFLLRQTKSVQEYTRKFRECVAFIPDMDERDKKFQYWTHLKPDVKQHVLSDRSVKTFEDMVESAHHFDMGKYQCGMHLSDFMPAAVTPVVSQPTPMAIDTLQGKQSATPQQKKGQPSYKQQQPYRCEHGVYTSGDLSKVKQHLSQNHGCFYCRQCPADHTAINCPKKRLNKRTQ